MAHVSTYLNFERNTEEAFTYYKSVFGTEFVNGITRMADVGQPDDAPPLSDEDKQLVVNVQLPITGGHMLMGTDVPESTGFTVTQGNNVHICLHPDTREEADRLFAVLSDGGEVGMKMADMFWGDYFGTCSDKFGIYWMINCAANG